MQLIRMFFIFIAVSFLLFSCSESKSAKQKTVHQFSWLSGYWLMKDSTGGASEQWKYENDSLMTGISNFIKGDSVIPFETIRLFKKDTTFYYEVKAAGQNNEQPVAFKLITITDSGFISENMRHDFPKRIGYKMINKDSVTAFIDGGAADAERRMDFYYNKITNK
jgi:hypothetical protein